MSSKVLDTVLKPVIIFAICEGDILYFLQIFIYLSCFTIFFKLSSCSCKLYYSSVADNSPSSSSGKLFKLSGIKFVLTYIINCLNSSLSYTLRVDRKWLSRCTGSLWQSGIGIGDICAVRTWSFFLRSLLALRGRFLWPLFQLDIHKALFLSFYVF